MFRKLLIANRGEIARRIVRVARRHGMKSAVIYSDADAALPYVREADEAWRVGPAPARESYLDAAAILDIAAHARVDAIHPGYGFLSENASFAAAVAKAGFAFVGPPPEVLARIGDKSAARARAASAGIPVLPGSGEVRDERSALAEGERLGYPLLVKAVGGGGGIGMARAENAASLAGAFREASRRAQSAFGRGGVYLERLIERPRHVEVQILADGSGHVLHLYERECSLQRRHQKVLEEARSPLFCEPSARSGSAALERRLHAAALDAAHAFGYVNAGTVEFLIDGEQLYFIELNARLQVEHAISEQITGVELIGWQLRIAEGRALDITQEEVRAMGHALELRILAEDPDTFLPSPGLLKEYQEPTGEGIRVDGGYERGNGVTPYYDPLIAKLIVFGSDRAHAIGRARRALADFRIEGIKSNLALHARVLESERFWRGELDTGFLTSLAHERAAAAGT